ncbi:MAG: hypothetical protein K2Q22_00940, partial [Cytophagales bacterium]|nr:hypothetical protein [Cytophagales bacterium]
NVYPTGNTEFLGLVTTAGLTVKNLVGPGMVTVDGLGNLGLGAIAATSSSQWVSTIGGTIFYNGGKVGIGTNNPATDLDVSNSSATAQIYVNGTSSNYSAINFATFGVGNQYGLGRDPGNNFYIAKQGVGNFFMFSPTGLTSIGSTPGVVLAGTTTIAGGLKINSLIGPGTLTVDGLGNIGLSTSSSTSQWTSTTSGTIYYNSGNVEIGYPAGGGGVFNIGSSGPAADFRAGYGTAGAALRLGVKNGVLFNTPELVFYAQTTGGMAYVMQSIVYGSGPGAAVLINPTAGNVGIGVSASPNAKLTVGGTVSISGITTLGGLNVRNLIGPGTVTVDGLGNLGVGSYTNLNLWTVSGTSLTPSNSAYGLNVGNNITTTGIVNIATTSAVSGLIVTGYNTPANNGAIWGYSYPNNTGGVAGWAYGSNSVGVYGTTSNSASVGIQADNGAGGTAFKANSTVTTPGIDVAQIQHQGTVGNALSIQVSSGSSSATGLSIQATSPTSIALLAQGKVQFSNYTNGTLTVDGAGNLGVSPSVNSGPGSGFLAISTTVQSIPAATVSGWNIIQFPIEQFDDANAFNSPAANGYTVPSTGVYQINASVPFGNIGQVDIAVNVAGSLVLVNSVSTSPTTGIVTSVNISGTIKLLAGNQVFINVRQFTGQSQNTASSGTGANASFSMVKLY